MNWLFICRRISTINRYLRDKGYDVDKMWADIDDVIIKTLISAHSVLKHNYRTCFPNHVKGSACFEILGFDVLLDRKLRPQVLEVSRNHNSLVALKLYTYIYIYILLYICCLGLFSRFYLNLKRDWERERERLISYSLIINDMGNLNMSSFNFCHFVMLFNF